MINNEKILTIDLGTASVRAALTVVKGEERKTNITSSPSRGIRNGSIVNVQSAKDSLQTALNNLKLESSTTLPNEAWAIIPGTYTLGVEVEAKISFPGLKTIDYNDINIVKNKVKEELKRIKGFSIKNYYDVIHILPQEFIVDHVDGIQNPIGHSGKSLTIKAFVIMASRSYLKTLEDLFRDLGLRLKGVVLQVLAAFYGVRDEKTYFNNALFLYLGAGNTEVLYLREDAPVFFKYEPFGAEDIIDTLVQNLKISKLEAERLYKEYGSAYANNVSKEEVITVNRGAKVLRLPKVIVPALIHLQLKKLVNGIKATLNEEDPSYISNLNKVFVTGGLAKMKDLPLLFERLFKAPVYVAVPQKELKDPAMAPIEGVVNYVLSLKQTKRLTDIKEDLTKDSFSKAGFFASIWRLITQYI